MDREYNLTIEDMTPTVNRDGVEHQGELQADGG